MDDKYIRIRKDYLWKGFAILIIVLLAGLLVFQIYNKMEEKEENEYTPVEYVDVTYDDLKSKITNKEDIGKTYGSGTLVENVSFKLVDGKMVATTTAGGYKLPNGTEVVKMKQIF